MPAETQSRSSRHHARRTPWYQTWYKKASLSRLSIAALLIVLLAGLSVHAGSLGLAHLQVIRVENTLTQWQKAGKVSSPQAMTDALRAIDRAVSLHADNPYQLSLKASLLEWRGYAAGDSDAALTDFRSALDLHRRATALRPLWPDTWAAMAGLKLQLNELDEELDFFLQQADKLGPYTAPVHTAVVQAGFAKLAQYPFQSVPLLQKHLLRGLSDHRSKGAVQTLVRQYRQEMVACRWLAQATQPKPKVGFCG